MLPYDIYGNFHLLYSKLSYDDKVTVLHFNLPFKKKHNL